VRRKLSQWFLKITDFRRGIARRLSELDHGPDKVRLMQENWIGRSQGLRFRFALAEPVAGADGFDSLHHALRDTIFGASFAAISPDQPIALASGGRQSGDSPTSSPNARRARTTAAELETCREEGIRYPASRVVHPLDPDWKLPVYIANFVLMDYGTAQSSACRATISATSNSRPNMACRSGASVAPQPTRPMRRSATKPRMAMESCQFALPRRHGGRRSQSGGDRTG
jgi:leucyl-tRNA synthetase